MMKIFLLRPFVRRLSEPIIGSKLMLFGFNYNLRKLDTIGGQFSQSSSIETN